MPASSARCRTSKAFFGCFARVCRSASAAVRAGFDGSALRAASTAVMAWGNFWSCTKAQGRPDSTRSVPHGEDHDRIALDAEVDVVARPRHEHAAYAATADDAAETRMRRRKENPPFQLVTK